MDFADWVGRTKRKVVYVTGEPQGAGERARGGTGAGRGKPVQLARAPAILAVSKHSPADPPLARTCTACPRNPPTPRPAGTMKRPVPLQHSLYYGGELYTICARDVFSAEGVRAAGSAWKKRNEVGAGTVVVFFGSTAWDG